MRVACAMVVGIVGVTGCVSDDILAHVTSAGGAGGGDSINLGSGGSGMSDDAGTPGLPSSGCTGLRCQLTSCRGGGCLAEACADRARTTVSGVVSDPAGKVPLYGVSVFVPNAPLAPVVEGVSCQRCDQATSGDPIVKATTDADGRFTLGDVPAGTDIPLVIETGKWRR